MTDKSKRITEILRSYKRNMFSENEVIKELSALDKIDEGKLREILENPVNREKNAPLLIHCSSETIVQSLTQRQKEWLKTGEADEGL